ncbi:unnamed protein product, partial [marine sediment metagenome]
TTTTKTRTKAKKVATKKATTVKKLSSKKTTPKKAVPKALEKKVVEKKSVAKKRSKKEVDFKKELIEELIETGIKNNQRLAYEEVVEFSTKNNLDDNEARELLKMLEKKGIELVTLEELEKSTDSADDDQGSKIGLGSKLKGSLAISDDEFDDEDNTKEEIKAITSAQIADGVKSYLRDIGKIPLLNKKTEAVIAHKIASGKKESIDAISKFPFIYKEIIFAGEKLSKDIIQVKDIVQFSEFDEENIPQIDEERNILLKEIEKS